MRRRLFSLCIGACVVAMAACGIPAGGTSDSVTGGGVSSSPPVQSESDSDGGSEEKAASVTIYVGTDGEYAEFPVEYTGERLETGQVPVTEVLSAMAKITGWNLDLADQIYSGKGGITVTFADTCTLLTADVSEEGNQSETAQRDQLVLDSVKKTLQCWAVDPDLGDPDAVAVWFCGPDGGDLVLAGTGITLSSTEPYTKFPSA